MLHHTNSEPEAEYWSQRYQQHNTGWDIGAVSTPLKVYIDQLNNKNLKVLIPGAGNSYEAEYLFNNGFKNVFVLDIAQAPLKAFQKRVPNFPSEQIIQNNFFKHEGRYDLILEQTFFCSFPPLPENRKQYALKMDELLHKQGKIAGLWFNFPLNNDFEKRPFGGSEEEYLNYFKPLFSVHTFKTCYNSIPSRMGREFFGIFKKK